MCHQISWYRAMCLHPDPSWKLEIPCQTAIKAGTNLCNKVEVVILPMPDTCEICKMQEWLEKNLSVLETGFAEDQEDSCAEDHIAEWRDACGPGFVSEEFEDDESEMFDRITF
ncbi:hypothetical protein ASPZODRAFT_18319 [Penicilliopsis zonata CBS 506.65]|uniref:Uncharacterized protein n=1 Tax=Penicilliopsis zonata CBS 506.65 TaxID=1073090 RepID=A0A1L9SC89_9EURO|nr:hypothetical protein ASPZODRAFT_18319 [Penicilliopsis zonata CBS 506.65]OJJ44748.1 hypothetical protein ASPZODRAFT_18319 [Penicilliopsis zonata CBS 506.65]